MCDGMATRSHALVIVALQLLLFLTALPAGQASGCSRPSAVLHGRGNLTETNRGSFPVGTVLQYSCDSGYTLSGESIITCIAPGHWSSVPPHCLKNDVCRPPSEPENGGYMCHPSPCPRLTEGTVIEYFCDEGYTLKGYRYHTCRNGDWDSAAPIICHLGQGKEERSSLGMPALSIMASTASSVALILLLVVLFVLLQPKLKSFHHSSLPSTSTSTSARSCHSETVLVHQDPSSSSPSSSSSSSTWVSEQRGAAAAAARRPSSTSSDQHSLLSLTSVEEYGDDIPLLKEA
ncbi:hypothetical protein PGIGA_G00101730 [Pangasianodon gigas]|uniref:Uncharacterized protein n=1 Tax=Pangasianodon gigas TaxID=30993 RepID=A0ACC5XEG6_PANGG|nr:hypothetical protein [Pangasianodon gigas]